ncbi:hypothetical protein K4F52_002879 [Lecanicillium sp. MT-2017a]|nr:hypothetical protein K4F52_002879 [Lecanicillium sp. MT-2017a]
MPSPVFAPALKPGATIAFVSLSMRLNDVFPDAIARASGLFASRGFKVRVFFSKDDGIQSSIDNRLTELREAFLDPNISAIICTIGGSSFTELLPALVQDKGLHDGIRSHPKIVVGLSDMTGLHWFLHAYTGLRTFYGPSAIPELGTADNIENDDSPLAFCVKALLAIVGTPKAIGDIPRSVSYAPKAPDFFQDPASTKLQELSPSPPWIWLRPGKARGQLYGGCLSVMVRLNGVRSIVPEWKGSIVFLESSMNDIGDVDQVRNSIADLIAHGVFEEAAGLVVGRPVGYDSEESRMEYLDVIKSLLCEGRQAETNNFPILCNVDIGHTTPMVTLPFGGLVELDSEASRFTVLEAAVI